MSASVVIFSKPGCCLCDEVKTTVLEARRRRSFELTEVNIEADPMLLSEYQYDVPVVTINGRRAFKYRLSLTELLARLERD